MMKMELVMNAQSLTLKPERFAQLADYAERHDQDAATALDTALAEFFEWERQDHEETVAAVLAGNEDIEAGRTRPAEEVYQSLCLKHGL